MCTSIPVYKVTLKSSPWVQCNASNPFTFLRGKSCSSRAVGGVLSCMAGLRVCELQVVSHLERCWSQPAGVCESSKGLSWYCALLGQEMLGFSQKYISILAVNQVFMYWKFLGRKVQSQGCRFISTAAEGGDSWNHRAGLRRCGRECTFTIPPCLKSVQVLHRVTVWSPLASLPINRLMLCSSWNWREIFGYLIIMALLNVNNMYQEGLFNRAIHQVILHTTPYWNTVQLEALSQFTFCISVGKVPSWPSLIITVNSRFYPQWRNIYSVECAIVTILI